VQLRRYLEIPSRFTIDYNRVMQQVAEFQLTRRSLPQGRIALRRVGEDEPHFPTFATQGIDFFEGHNIQGGSRTLRDCHKCHQGIGAISFTSYSRVQFEQHNLFILMRVTTETQEVPPATAYLQSRDSWKLLQRQNKTGFRALGENARIHRVTVLTCGSHEKTISRITPTRNAGLDAAAGRRGRVRLRVCGRTMQSV